MSILLGTLCALCSSLAVDAAQMWPFHIIPPLTQAALDSVAVAQDGLGDFFSRLQEAGASSQVGEILGNLTYETNFTNWVLRNCSEKLAGEGLTKLRGNFLTSMLAAISANGDQRTVNLCFLYIDSFKEQVNRCNMTSLKTLLDRADAFKTQLQLAQHHKWMLTNGQDPLGLYTVNISSTFVPPHGQPPIKLADWFLAKTASLDFFTRKSIDAKARLDDAYLLTYRLINSMAGVVDGFGVKKTLKHSDPDTFHAQFVIKTLQAHLEHLHTILQTLGASAPLEVLEEPLVEELEPVDPTELAVQALEQNLTYSVAFKPFVIENCSAEKAETGVRQLEHISLAALLSGVSARNDAKYISQGLAWITDFKRMIRACDRLMANNSTLLLRVNQVEDGLHQVAHHKWMVTNGQDPIGLYSQFSKPSDFVPTANSKLLGTVNWMIGKVTGLDFLTHKAVASARGLDEAYIASIQVRVAMQHVIDSMGEVNNHSSPVDQRGKVVVEALQGHVQRLQALLSAHGAQAPPPLELQTLPLQPEPVKLQVAYASINAVLKYNTSFSPCAWDSCSKTQVERRLTELEEKSLIALLAFASLVGDPRTFSAARNATNEMMMHIDECNISSWRNLTVRTIAIQSELESGAHHRWMVANGKDPFGLYQLGTSITPPFDKTLLEKADWFMGKVTSIDSLTHKAVDGNGNLDEAYLLNSELAGAMSSAQEIAPLSSDIGDVRAALILQALIDHTKNLQDLLRLHGAMS